MIETLQEIDKLVEEYLDTKNDKLLNDIIILADPIIIPISKKYTPDQSKDLAQIIRMDIIDLIKVRYTPDAKQPFHYLMLRQIKNKAKNFVFPRKKDMVLNDIEKFYHLTAGTTPEYDYELKELISIIPVAIKRYGYPSKYELDMLILDYLKKGFKLSEISKMVEMSTAGVNNRLSKIRGYLEEYQKMKPRP